MSKEKGDAVKKDTKRSILIPLILVALYVAVHVVLILKHEIWRDEAYVWVLGKNGSFSDTLKEMSLVGHPGLWFFYLRIFALIGFPFRYIGFLSLIPVTAALWILLRDEQLSFPVRLLLFVSPLFMFFNAVVCRPYCFSVLFLVLMLRWFPDRAEKPVRYCIAAALLAQTHVVFAGFCLGILIELWGYGKKKGKTPYAAMGILLAGLAALMLQLWQWDPENTTRQVNLQTLLDKFTVSNIREGLESLFLYNIRFVGWFLLALTILLLVYFSLAARRYRVKDRFRAVIPAVFGVLFFIAVVCFIRPVEHEQMGICLLMILFFFFAASLTGFKGTGTKEQLLAFCFLALFVLSGARYTLKGAWQDLTQPYSGSLEAAKQLETELPEGAVLALVEDQSMEAPYAYLSEKRGDIRYYNVDRQEDYSFYRWKGGKAEPEERLARLDALEGSSVYLLSNKALPEGLGREAAYQSSRPSKWNEDYYLYRVR